MGGGKDMWIADVERAADQYVTKEIDEGTFRGRMMRLGFNLDEINDHLSELDKDRNNG